MESSTDVDDAVVKIDVVYKMKRDGGGVGRRLTAVAEGLKPASRTGRA